MDGEDDVVAAGKSEHEAKVRAPEARGLVTVRAGAMACSAVEHAGGDELGAIGFVDGLGFEGPGDLR